MGNAAQDRVLVCRLQSLMQKGTPVSPTCNELVANASKPKPYLRDRTRHNAGEGHQKGIRASVCLTGQPRGTLGFTLQSIIKNLVGQLPGQADVFVVSTPDLDATVLDSLAVSIVRNPTPSPASMRAMLNRTDRYGVHVFQRLIQTWSAGAPTDGFGHSSLWGWLLQVHKHMRMRIRACASLSSTCASTRLHAHANTSHAWPMPLAHAHVLERTEMAAAGA